MARIFGKVFGGARALAQARAAELRGELAHAAALFGQAGRHDEAARVLIARGDGEPDATTRLRYYGQAVATAPDQSSARINARRKRANAVLTMATMANEAPLTSRLKQQLIEAAGEFEALGDDARAAEAYARAGEMEGQTRALARAGDIDRLDALLGDEQGRHREALARRQAHDELGLLVATGRRRDAVRLARASADEALQERGRAIEARRVAGPILSVILDGHRLMVALGDEVVIGRTPDQGATSPRTGTLTIASVSVSRRQLCLVRRGTEVFVRDLGSRNGTMLRGLALQGEVNVGEGIELSLGRDVALIVQPTSELEGGVAIEVAGARYIAPLGPALLGIGRWRLERTDDGWIELSTDDAPPAFAGSLRLSKCVTLVQGDSFASERGGKAVLEVRENGR